MLSRFPFSLEQLGRARRCGCLSLRAGCVLVALAVILYSVLALAPVLAEMSLRPPAAAHHWAGLVAAAVLHVLACLFSALMLVGVLRDVSWMVRPWLVLTTLQLCAGALALLLAALTALTAGRAQLRDVAVQFLLILVRLYMVTVVGSYCRELEEGAAERARLTLLLRDSWYTDV